MNAVQSATHDARTRSRRPRVPGLDSPRLMLEPSAQLDQARESVSEWEDQIRRGTSLSGSGTTKQHAPVPSPSKSTLPPEARSATSCTTFAMNTGWGDRSDRQPRHRRRCADGDDRSDVAWIGRTLTTMITMRRLVFAALVVNQAGSAQAGRGQQGPRDDKHGRYAHHNRE